MSIEPLFNSACDFAERIPAMVSDFLDLENRVGRRFREDSVTDILIASLLRIAGSNATVLVPPETKTGGDFDIMIVEPATGDAIQYRIQAKRLSPHATEWNWGSYRELAHPHNSGGQSSTLIRSAAHERITTIPLYAFYNPEAVCQASGGKFSGIELADGREINQIVKTLVKAKPKKPRLKRVEYLMDLFFPLATILCPPTGSAGTSTSIISPRISRQAVEAAIGARARARPEWMWVEEVPRLPRQRPKQLAPPADRQTTLPPPVRPGPSRLTARRFSPLIDRAIIRDGGERIQVARVKRPKVLIISGPRVFSGE